MRTQISRKTVFLTGSSGVLGKALLQQLKDYAVIALVHQKPVEGPNVVEVIQGDITKPRFGLNREEFQLLARRINWIIHLAANTSFSGTDIQYRRTNIDGTRNVLELADAADVPLYHLSTAFVHPCKYAEGSPPATSYENSKREAEQLVRQSGLRITILRPSIILGDSQTGAIARFQGFHITAEMIISGRLPIFPGNPASYVDLIPVDYVARVIVSLLDRAISGGEYFLTNGNQAFSLEKVVSVIVSEASHYLGQTVSMPRFISPEVFYRLIKPVFLPSLPSKLRTSITRVLRMIRYINLQEPLPSSLQELSQHYGIPSMPDIKAAIRQNIRYLSRCYMERKRKDLGSVCTEV